MTTLGKHLVDLYGQTRVTVISNSKVWGLTAKTVDKSIRSAGIVFDLAMVPDGEEYKAIDTAVGLYDSLIDFEATRDEPLVALGGGVIGDLAGFVAATYMRGIPFIQVPTTLLAQVDSSVGGKVAVNLPSGKNLVGAFYQPSFVVADTDVLKDLDKRQFSQGLAEVIKCAFLKDEEFVSLLEKEEEAIKDKNPKVLTEIIKRAVEYKGEVVSLDEEDTKNIRARLNFGHTVGHALETMGLYADLLHGDAVAIGMIAAARISSKAGLIDGSLVERLRDLIMTYGLPTELPADLDLKRIREVMYKDKKRKAKEVVFVLLKGIGKPVIKEVGDKQILEVLEEIRHG